MMNKLTQATVAVGNLDRGLKELATIHSSETGPEDLVEHSERLMADIDANLRSLLGTLCVTSYLDHDDMRNLVLGGDTLCVHFYGNLGAGCLTLQADEHTPISMEDLTCDRALTRFWSFVKETQQPDDAVEG